MKSTLLWVSYDLSFLGRLSNEQVISGYTLSQHKPRRQFNSFYFVTV